MGYNLTKALEIYHQPDEDTRAKYMEQQKIPANSI
jgi:hypothetical protein